jgi:hypothetical protein
MSTNAAASSASATQPSAPSGQQNQQLALQQGGGIQTTEIPAEKTLVHAARIAVEQDKPILLDYYNDTKNAKAFLGEDPDTKERILVKNAEEYTSPIQKIFKAATDYIVMTENSIYIVSGAIKKKIITTGNSGPTSSGRPSTATA